MTDGAFHAPPVRLAWFSEAIVAALPDPLAPVSILDIGCGAGDQILDLAERLPSARFVGVDIAAQNVAVASRRAAASPHAARLAFEHADYRRYAAPRPFDLAFSYSVLQFVPGGADALARRIVADVRPEGVFVNVMPRRCAYNTVLAALRRLLAMTRSAASDRLLFRLARLLHEGELDRAMLAERLEYAYLTPLQYEEDLAAAAERLGMRTTRREAVRQASPAQLQHALRVMRRTAVSAGGS